MILLTIWTKIQTPIEGRKCIIVEQSHIPNIDHIFNQSFSLEFKITFRSQEMSLQNYLITPTEFYNCHIWFTFIGDSSSLMHSFSLFLETGTLSLHRWVLAIFLKFFVLALKTRKHLSDAKVARFPLRFAVTSEKGSIFAQATPFTHPLWSLNIFNFVPKKMQAISY